MKKLSVEQAKEKLLKFETKHLKSYTKKELIEMLVNRKANELENVSFHGLDNRVRVITEGKFCLDMESFEVPF